MRRSVDEEPLLTGNLHLVWRTGVVRSVRADREPVLITPVSSPIHSIITMSAPTPGGDTYPGCDYSLSQLLYATKRKLQHAAFGGR